MTNDPPAGQGRKAGAPARALEVYRARKRATFSRIRLGYERTKQLFLLPGCYRRVRAIEDCTKSGPSLALDLLTWFFRYKTFPSHYGPCRLWEVERSGWAYYFGSNYLPHQQARLKKAVQPFEYRVLFNDKSLSVLLCKALGIPTPLTHGVLDPAGDYRARIADWLAASRAGRLIIKPLAAFGGRNIVLAERREGGIVVRGGRTETPLDEFALSDRAIVQDFMTQDARMAAFSSASVNTVRVVTMLTPQDDIIIVNASFRCGVGGAFVDNFYAGGVSPGIDRAKGTMMKYAYDKRSKRYTAHPTTGLVFENHPVPEWDRIVDTAVGVQRAFSFFRLIGLDIALDENGRPVIIEINHGPDLAGLEQKAGPLLKNENVLRAFGEYDLLFNRPQRRLYAALLGKEHPS